MKSNYDEISPITHNLSVLVEQDDATGLTSKICMDSGYTTNSFLIDGSETLSKLESSIAKTAFNFRVVDGNKNVWIPCMQATDTSSIYPIPDDVDNTTFMWQVTPIKKLTEDESKKYPDPNNIGKYLENYIDFENSVNFPKDKFTEAFKHFVNISYESLNN